MANTISPYMAEIMLDHYRHRLAQATTTAAMLFIEAQIQYYTSVKTKRTNKTR